jgi:hypothetical protein
LRFFETKCDEKYFSFHKKTKRLPIDALESYFGEDEVLETPAGLDKVDQLYPGLKLKKNINGKNVFVLFPSWFNTPPLWGVNTGGVGYLFPHKCNAFKVKSSIPRGSAAGIFY